MTTPSAPATAPDRARSLPLAPGSVVAAGCLAMISVWRWADGRFGWAVVFAALAGLQLVLAWLFGARTGAPRPAAGTELARDLEASHRRGWRRIAVLGVVLALASSWWAPPLAMVLAGLAAYAALRGRRPA